MKKLTFEELAALEDMTKITCVANGNESNLIKLCTVSPPHTEEKVVYVIRKIPDDKCFCVMNNKLFDRAYYFAGVIDYNEIARILISQVEAAKDDFIGSIKRTYNIK